MAAFIFATVQVKDPEKWGEYGKQAGQTLVPFGGELLFRGKFVEQLAGGEPHSANAVLKFPDVQAARDWYASPAYQAIIPTRDAGADVVFSLCDEIS